MNPDMIEFFSGALTGIGFVGGCIFWLMFFKSFT